MYFINVNDSFYQIKPFTSCSLTPSSIISCRITEKSPISHLPRLRLDTLAPIPLSFSIITAERIHSCFIRPKLTSQFLDLFPSLIAKFSVQHIHGPVLFIIILFSMFRTGTTTADATYMNSTPRLSL